MIDFLARFEGSIPRYWQTYSDCGRNKWQYIAALRGISSSGSHGKQGAGGKEDEKTEQRRVLNGGRRSLRTGMQHALPRGGGLYRLRLQRRIDNRGDADTLVVEHSATIISYRLSSDLTSQRFRCKARKCFNRSFVKLSRSLVLKSFKQNFFSYVFYRSYESRHKLWYWVLFIESSILWAISLKYILL